MKFNLVTDIGALVCVGHLLPRHVTLFKMGLTLLIVVMLVKDQTSQILTYMLQLLSTSRIPENDK